MKRFVETNDWHDPAIRRLSQAAKHLRRYLWDNCNAAGVIHRDFDAFTFHIGEPVEEKHLAELGDWVETLANGRLLIPSFIHEQVGIPSEASRAHIPILKAIQVHGLIRSGKLYHQNPHSLCGELSLEGQRDKDKEEDKDKEQVQEEEQYTHYPAKCRTKAFHEAWMEWHEFRREIRHKLTPTAIKRQFKDLEPYTEPVAIAAIHFSISKGYRGLFPERIAHETNQRNHSTSTQRTTGADQRKVGIPDAPRAGKLSELLANRARKSTANGVAAKAPAVERGQSGGSTHG